MKKTIKAWTVLNKKGELQSVGTTGSPRIDWSIESAVAYTMLFGGTIAPCTITYKVPKKKLKA